MWEPRTSVPQRTQGQPEGDSAFDIDAVEWARRKLGFEADETQARVLRSRSRRLLLNCTRQWGKSTVTAVKAAHHAAHAPGSLTLAVSPTERQSGEFVRKAEQFLARAGIRTRGDGHNRLSLELANGARIVGLPGTEGTVRGFSAVSLLVIDEASRASDELYFALRPMLAVRNGTLCLMSTPWGKRGFFWEEWSGGGDWERVKATAEECARIPQEFLEEERGRMTDRWFRQEYLCEFTETTTGLFSGETIEQAFSDRFGALRV